MAIKNINRSKCDDKGEANEIICPSCGTSVKMRLFKAVDYSVLPALLNKSDELEFVVCPNCSEVFKAHEDYFKELENGTTVFLEAADLTPVKRS